MPALGSSFWACGESAVRGLAVLGLGLSAITACSTVFPRPAPPGTIFGDFPCAHEWGPGPNAQPNGHRPEGYAAFPDIENWSSLKISVQRTSCSPMGPEMCFPAYSVTIAGDGTVTWHGEDFVKTKGDAVAHIAREKVHALFEAFRKAEFFWLFDEYAAEATHVSALTTTITFDGHTKTVRDYAGDSAGMPQVVSELRCAVDEAANTAHWIGASHDPARELPQ